MVYLIYHIALTYNRGLMQYGVNILTDETV